MKNYVQIKEDNSLRDQSILQLTSHHTKAEFINCFIIYSKYFKIPNKLNYLLVDFLAFDLFLGPFLGCMQMFFLVDTP